MLLTTLGLLIGLFSTAVHGVLLVFFVSDLIHLPYLLSDNNDAAIISRPLIALEVFFFILEVALCIASILLFIGIRKERPKFMAPWIYLTVIFIVSHLLDLMRYTTYIEHHQADFTVILKVLPIVLLAVVWYPVFKIWRKLIKTLKSRQSEDTPGSSNKQGDATCPSKNDNDHKSPMLYPNLGDGSRKPTDESVPEQQKLYPHLP